MYLRKLILWIALMFSVYGNTQIIYGDNFTIEIKQTKINAFNFTSSSSWVILPKDMEKLWVRIRITSKSKKRQFFNPNAFSIVSNEHKCRFRPAEAKFAYMMHGFKSFLILNTDDKEELNSRYGRRRQENSRDIFLDYNLEGYKNIPMVINYGTKRKPKNVSIYYASEKFSNKTIDYYFGVHNSLKSVDLYYKDQKITTIAIN